MIISNVNINVTEEGWTEQVGAVQTVLKVINKTGREILANEKFDCNIGVLRKGNHAFVFINPPKLKDDRILGLFAGRAYNFTVVQGEVVFVAESTARLESAILAICHVGVIIKSHSYKNRSGARYFRFDPDGWIDLGIDAVLDEQEIKAI